jgi:hypothetical protein
MKLELLVELAIEMRGPEYVRESPQKRYQANLRTRVIASAASNHSRFSSASWRRPAAVTGAPLPTQDRKCFCDVSPQARRRHTF